MAAFAGRAAGRVALEIEWIVVDGDDPRSPVDAAAVLAAFTGPLPAGGRLSVEPGGQLELSTRCWPGPTAALAAAEADETVLRRRGEAVGLRLLAVGTDPLRDPLRSVDTPRYRAMAAALAADGPAGAAMMCSTASLQVDVDYGPDPAATWRRATLVAPVLAAAFANAPFRAGRRTGDASSRARIWAGLDQRRAGPAPVAPEDWPRYVLAAPVLFVRTPTGDAEVPDPPMTMADWLAHGHRLGHPDRRDLAEHCTTLFPPVRPRGWLECRFLDAVPARWRRLAVTVLVALLDEATPFDPLADAAGRGDPWADGAEGLRPVAARHRAAELATLAAATLDATDPAGAEEVRRWRDGPVAGGITPADDTAAALSCPDHTPCPELVARGRPDLEGGAVDAAVRPLRHAGLAVLGQGAGLSP